MLAEILRGARLPYAVHPDPVLGWTPFRCRSASGLSDMHSSVPLGTYSIFAIRIRPKGFTLRVFTCVVTVRRVFQ